MTIKTRGITKEELERLHQVDRAELQRQGAFIYIDVVSHGLASLFYITTDGDHYKSQRALVRKRPKLEHLEIRTALNTGRLWLVEEPEDAKVRHAHKKALSDYAHSELRRMGVPAVIGLLSDPYALGNELDLLLEMPDIRRALDEYDDKGWSWLLSAPHPEYREMVMRVCARVKSAPKQKARSR